VLLVAALNDSPSLSEALQASARVFGPDLTIDVLIPAVSARLVELGETDIAFWHPLMRSAIPQRASMSQRHAAHAALADVLIDQPERRVWHRAASLIGPSESVAAELVDASRRAQRQGGNAVAIAGLERAAQLSEDSAALGADGRPRKRTTLIVCPRHPSVVGAGISATARTFALRRARKAGPVAQAGPPPDACAGRFVGRRGSRARRNRPWR
jgi:hypothetical protein